MAGEQVRKEQGASDEPAVWEGRTPPHNKPKARKHFSNLKKKFQRLLTNAAPQSGLPTGTLV
jgi:hypothetical protein